MNRSAKDGLILGTTLLLIHTFAVFLVFLYCHTSTEDQTVFTYFLFFALDAPTVPWAFDLEGTIGLLSGLSDLWADLWYYGHHGANLRAFILTTFFGGLHWFAIGNLISHTIVWIQERRKRLPAC